MFLLPSTISGSLDGSIVGLVTLYHNRIGNIIFIAAVFRGLIKEKYLMIILGCFLLFLHKTGCGYSLEVPQRGTSNEYLQHVFMTKNLPLNYNRILLTCPLCKCFYN